MSAITFQSDFGVTSPRKARPSNKALDPAGVQADLRQMEKRIDHFESRFDAILPTLATKADIGEVRTDMQALRADMHKMDASIKTWMIATLIGLFFGFSGLFFAMNTANRLAPAQAATPMIIQLPASAVTPPLP